MTFDTINLEHIMTLIQSPTNHYDNISLDHLTLDILYPLVIMILNKIIP